jgi:hypothetical protein
MTWIRSLQGLRDFLSLVIVHAPDEFPQEDFLKDSEQLNLASAFDELNSGLRFVEQRINDAAVLKRLKDILDASLASYRLGDDVKGAHLLHEFESVLTDHLAL